MNEIKLTRGDSLHLDIVLTNDEGVYELQEGDVMVFTLKQNTFTNEVIVQKEIIDNQFSINPEDTRNLSYGSYKYDIQVTFANGDVCTVIKPSDFVITEEVNYD